MPETLPAIDTPPTNGVYVEHDDLVLTPQEAHRGNYLGFRIKTNNDDDNGLPRK